MSSSYLLNLKINQLQQEVQGIGESVGYFWNLSSTTGLTIDGGDTAVNISAPSGNNTASGSSSVSRSAPWVCTAVVQPNSNMWFGVSTDITQTFPNPSAPSMANCNHGWLADTDGLTDGYTILNGVITGSTSVSSGDVVSITYDGTNITYTVNGLSPVVVSVPTLQPVKLVCGSFFGGELNQITWSGLGSSGGGGGLSNLEDVLAAGNDAGNLDITNLNNLYVSEIHKNPSDAVITINNNISAQNIYAIEGLDLAENQAVKFALSGGDTMNIYADTTNPELQFEYEDENNITTQLLSINKTNMTFTFGEQDIDDPTIPTLKVQGVANDTPFEGLVLDTVINPPQSYIYSSISNQITKAITSGTPTSILKINTGVYNYYNSFNSYLKTLSFQNNLISSNPSVPITALFYLSDTQDADYDNSTPLYVGYTTPNINPSGGNPNVDVSKIILSNVFNSSLTDLYLNVKISSSNLCVCEFSNFNIEAYTQGDINYILTINPTLITT